MNLNIQFFLKVFPILVALILILPLKNNLLLCYLVLYLQYIVLSLLNHPVSLIRFILGDEESRIQKRSQPFPLSLLLKFLQVMFAVSHNHHYPIISGQHYFIREIKFMNFCYLFVLAPKEKLLIFGVSQFDSFLLKINDLQLTLIFSDRPLVNPQRMFAGRRK